MSLFSNDYAINHRNQMAIFTALGMVFFVIWIVMSHSELVQQDRVMATAVKVTAYKNRQYSQI